MPVRPPIWESLGLSQGQQSMVGIGALILILALVVVVWSTWPESVPVDDVVQPAVAQNSQPAAPAPPTALPARIENGPVSEPISIADPKQPELTAAERADLESSRAAHEQALAKTPDDPETLNSLGQVLVRLNRPDEALVRFERAVVLAPSRAVYHFNVARAASDLGRRSRAVEECREAARLLPADPATRYTLGLALQKNNDHAGALPEFERAIALAPADPRPHLAYAVSLDHLQLVPDAVREYGRYLEMRPTAPEADEVKGRIQTIRPGQP